MLSADIITVLSCLKTYSHLNLLTYVSSVLLSRSNTQVRDKP